MRQLVALTQENSVIICIRTIMARRWAKDLAYSHPKSLVTGILLAMLPQASLRPLLPCQLPRQPRKLMGTRTSQEVHFKINIRHPMVLRMVEPRWAGWLETRSHQVWSAVRLSNNSNRLLQDLLPIILKVLLLHLSWNPKIKCQLLLLKVSIWARPWHVVTGTVSDSSPVENKVYLLVRPCTRQTSKIMWLQERQTPSELHRLSGILPPLITVAVLERIKACKPPTILRCFKTQISTWLSSWGSRKPSKRLPFLSRKLKRGNYNS